jgi:phage gp46-like protein
MFDLATRPQQPQAAAALLAGVPFDLRLAPPSAPEAYPYTSLINPTGSPQPGTEALATYALALESGLATAVLISLFTDGRALPDDELPLGQTERRGWVGDEFMGAADTEAAPQSNDGWGSLLWLVLTGKAAPDVPERARFYASQALAWMVRDGVVGRVDVVAQWVPTKAGARDRLALRVTLWEPGEARPVYDVLWGTGLQRWSDG